MQPENEVVPHSGQSSIKELQTRFLYPFYFEPTTTEHLYRVLLEDRLTARSGKTFPLWEHAKPHAAYLDELLDHARCFLFSDSGQEGCLYLKLSAGAADAWFGGLELDTPGGPGFSLVAGPRIEVFLSPKGLGVLSVALAPNSRSLNIEEVYRFNYTIGQFRRRDIAKLRRQHPGDDKEVWQRIPSEQQAQISSAPDEAAPLAARLGAPGGSFFLWELIEQRLLPVEALGLRPAQKELSVYTVVRLGSEVDFASSSCRNELAPLLSGLAQLEEPEHAGAASEILSVSNTVFNRKHWAAMGQLGAAHLIADQLPPSGREDHPFNAQRLPIIRDKYFIPYLVALFQKLALNRAVNRAHSVLSLPRELAEQHLDGLRRDLFEFGVSGHFAQVSIRDALHRYYRLAQQGLDIPFIWQNVREAISDLDAKYSSERQAEMANRQSKMAGDMAENIGVIAGVQRLLHLIEYLLASVYLAHLWHMFRGEEHGYNWEIAVSAGLGLLGVFIVNHLLERRSLPGRASRKGHLTPAPELE